MSPCRPVNLYQTPREQGQSQIQNYTCIMQFEASLQSMRDWKAEKLKLYEKHPK